MAAKGCVTLYAVDGKPYFLFPGWANHQRIRNYKPQFPEPDGQAVLTQSAANGGEWRPTAANGGLNTIQSNTIQSESESESEYSAEPKTPPAPPVVELPLNDGDSYPVTQAQVAEWGSLYPAVDVMQQLRAMKGWLNANPAKRKTKRGILRFVNAWLSREQDRGRGAPAKPAEPVRKYNHDTGKWEIVEG